MMSDRLVIKLKCLVDTSDYRMNKDWLGQVVSTAYKEHYMVVEVGTECPSAWHESRRNLECPVCGAEVPVIVRGKWDAVSRMVAGAGAVLLGSLVVGLFILWQVGWACLVPVLLWVVPGICGLIIVFQLWLGFRNRPHGTVALRDSEWSVEGEGRSRRFARHVIVSTRAVRD